MRLLCAGGGSMAAQALFATVQKRILPSSVADTGLSSLDMPTAESYWLHPAVLDSALHIGAYLGASQGAAVKVPVAFANFAAMTKLLGCPRQAHNFCSIQHCCTKN